MTRYIVSDCKRMRRGKYDLIVVASKYCNLICQFELGMVEVTGNDKSSKTCMLKSYQQELLAPY